MSRWVSQSVTVPGSYACIISLSWTGSGAAVWSWRWAARWRCPTDVTAWRAAGNPLHWLAAWRRRHEGTLPDSSGDFHCHAGVLGRGPQARSARGAVSAHRQTGARIPLANARYTPASVVYRGDAWPGLAAQCEGFVVQRLPRGASGSGRAFQG